VFDLAAEADQDHSAAVALVNTVELGERRSEQPEQLGREGLIAADALGFGDEAEQSLGVACGERRHGLQRYDECRMDSTPRSGELLSRA
jgi:hypothetical protein